MTEVKHPFRIAVEFSQLGGKYRQINHCRYQKCARKITPTLAINGSVGTSYPRVAHAGCKSKRRDFAPVMGRDCHCLFLVLVTPRVLHAARFAGPRSADRPARSEERRVGKKCRDRW